MATTATNIMDANGNIKSNLRGDVMRISMENKNLLKAKGSVYAGTGQYITIQTDSGEEQLAITEAVDPGNENGQVLMVDQNIGCGLKFGKITSNNIENTDFSTQEYINYPESIGDTPISINFTEITNISTDNDCMYLVWLNTTDLAQLKSLNIYMGMISMYQLLAVAPYGVITSLSKNYTTINNNLATNFNNNLEFKIENNKLYCRYFYTSGSSINPNNGLEINPGLIFKRIK